MVSDMIKVWRYDDLPPAYKDVLLEYNDPSDCDWVAVVPRNILEQESYISWLQLPAFGCCDVVEIKLKNGDSLFAGYHA